MEQCSKKEIDNEEMKKSVVGCLRCLTFLKLLVLAASTWQDVENSKMLPEIERHTKLWFDLWSLKIEVWWLYGFGVCWRPWQNN